MLGEGDGDDDCAIDGENGDGDGEDGVSSDAEPTVANAAREWASNAATLANPSGPTDLLGLGLGCGDWRDAGDPSLRTLAATDASGELSVAGEALNRPP